MRLDRGLLGALLFIHGSIGHAQVYRPETRAPSAEAISAAQKMCTDLFARLKEGKTEAVAEWIVAETAYTRDSATRLNLRNDFKSKLDIALAGPPVSPFGKLTGYDLLDESYLPGSDRYFRLVYISYHEGAPLLWEMRFYVKADGKATLNYLTWSDKNPFEYLSTPEIMLPRWLELKH